MGIGAQWCEQHHPAVDTDPQLEPTEGVHLGDHAVLHRHGCADSAFGIVSVRDRCAEQRHDLVADHPGDGSAVIGDDQAEHRQAAVNDRVNVLRITVLSERREADQISEQHRRVAALRLPNVRSDRRTACGAGFCTEDVGGSAVRTDHGVPPVPRPSVKAGDEW